MVKRASKSIRDLGSSMTLESIVITKHQFVASKIMDVYDCMQVTLRIN